MWSRTRRHLLASAFMGISIDSALFVARCAELCVCRALCSPTLQGPGLCTGCPLIVLSVVSDATQVRMMCLFSWPMFSCFT